MSSSLLFQQCPACLVRLTWIVFVMGGRWPYGALWGVSFFSSRFVSVQVVCSLRNSDPNFWFQWLLESIDSLRSFFAFHRDVLFYFIVVIAHYLCLYTCHFCPEGRGCRIHRLHLCRVGKTPPISVQDMTLNNIWEMRSILSSPSLSGPLWPGVVAPHKVLCTGQIELNCVG